MNALAVTYNYWLVAISIATSIAASYAAFSFSDRIAASRGTRSRVWLAGGALSMGLGIWSMHYLGMLAVQLPVPVTYYLPTVVLSLLLAALGSAITLALVSRDRIGGAAIGVGGILMGSAIGGMHYTGMSAMRSTAMHHYNLPIVELSVVVAIVFSWMSLWIAYSVRRAYRNGAWRRAGGAVLMGSGIAAMHYTAMGAVTFLPGAMTYSSSWTVKVSTLGVSAVVLITSLVLAGALVAAFYDRRRYEALRVTNERLAETQAKLIENEAALRKANSQLQVLAIHDGLTGIFNRRYFDETLQAELNRAARTGGRVSLLMIDVDCFKKLNDRYGHPTGDECLRKIAQRLKSKVLRLEDMVARYGGEEFAVLLPGASASGAFALAESLRTSVEDLRIHNEDSGVIPFVTVSIGIETRTPAVGETAVEIVASADAALYLAKTQGRNRVEPIPFSLEDLHKLTAARAGE